MNGKIYALAFACLFSTLLVTAQQPDPASIINHQSSLDTLLLPKRLTTADVDTPLYAGKERIEIISGSRFPVSAADLPFSSYVITKEEIRLMGYETLVDALKMAPGIRVSQPGNAVEGETFLMRGLFGNDYTKILINDVPIKPAFVGGMPIGAQLPVKEAERIEIIYGAGAALYGSDASAGIINIITRQSEKPVFMQAELSVGQGLYSSVNVMFGGKLGRDKHIFRYFAYASNVLLERRDIFYDTGYVYNPRTYLADTIADRPYAVLASNFISSLDSALLTNTPHLSRKFGLTLNYRSINLSVESMYRRDHSSIGLNPVAVSYRNPLTYTGEGIWRFNLNIFGSKSRRNSKTDITYTRYRLDNRSSIIWIRPQLTVELYRASQALSNIQDTASSPPPTIFLDKYQEYLIGLRYSYADCDEARIEHVRTFRLLNLMSATAGFNIRYAEGTPFTGLLSRPDEIKRKLFSNKNDLPSDGGAFVIAPQVKRSAEGNAFGQFFYNGKRFILAAGLNYAAFSKYLESVDAIALSFDQLSPRLAGLIKLGEKANLRFAWGRAFRLPGEYYKSVTYNINSDIIPMISRPFKELAPEITTSWEGGIRWKKGEKTSLDLTFFRNETSNLATFQTWGDGFNADSTIYQQTLGFRNTKDLKVRYVGGQIHLYQDLTWFRSKTGQVHYHLSWIKSASDSVVTNGKVYFLPVFSGTQHQMRLIFKILKKGTVAFDFVHVNGKLRNTTGNKDKHRFSTIDVVTRYAFTDRFDAYLKFINLTDKKYPGLPASNTEDDLKYNPQTGFTIRLGMNYYID